MPLIPALRADTGEFLQGQPGLLNEFQDDQLHGGAAIREREVGVCAERQIEADKDRERVETQRCRRMKRIFEMTTTNKRINPNLRLPKQIILGLNLIGGLFLYMPGYDIYTYTFYYLKEF